jgi:hypothetical protein
MKKMNKNAQIARFAGILYLFVIIFGVFAQMIVRGGLITFDDATVTAQQISASEPLFRLGFVSDLTMMVCYLFLAFTLYVLLKPIGKNLSLLFLLLTVVSVAIMCLNMLNQFSALLLLNGAEYLGVYDTNQLHTQALFFLNLHKYGYLIAQIFFGLWLFPLGFLVYQSGYFPKVLGVLLMGACIAHLVDFFAIFLFPIQSGSITELTQMPIILGEFSFCLWLLIMGAKQPASQRDLSLTHANQS